MKPKKGELGLLLLGGKAPKPKPREEDEYDDELDGDLKELEDDEEEVEENKEADEASEAVFDAVEARDSAGLQAALTDLLSALGY
jgi:hypothetical protein